MEIITSWFKPARLIGLLFALALSGCGSVTQSTKLEPGFVPATRFAVSVGEVTDASPPYPNDEKVDLDPVQTLRSQIEQKLVEHEVAAPPLPGAALYVLVSEIREYRPGSAFKRWLVPGYGSTVLWVESELRDGEKKVAQLHNKRTVDAGGAYTAGAYESIFSDLAEDIVKDLKSRLSGDP